MLSKDTLANRKKAISRWDGSSNLLRELQIHGSTVIGLSLQRQAFATNQNLLRPKVLPLYRPLPMPDAQAKAIVARVAEYRPKRGFLPQFEEAVAHLHRNASSNPFEQGLVDLGRMIGLSTERHDNNGEGPDVLWLLQSKIGLVIEAKSRKKETGALKKEDHGQLLVAKE